MREDLRKSLIAQRDFYAGVSGSDEGPVVVAFYNALIRRLDAGEPVRLITNEAQRSTAGRVPFAEAEAENRRRRREHEQANRVIGRQREAHPCHEVTRPHVTPREPHFCPRARSSASRGKSRAGPGSDPDGEPPPSPRWIANFDDLAAATADLSGPERLRFFEALPQIVQADLWSSLRRIIERERLG